MTLQGAIESESGLTAVNVVTPEEDSLLVRPHQVLVSPEDDDRVSGTEVQLVDGVGRSVPVDVCQGRTGNSQRLALHGGKAGMNSHS